MKTVTVKASQNYNVIIGTDILCRLGEFTAMNHSNCKVAVISDSNVFPLYGNIIEKSLHEAGFPAVHYVFPAGEENKNIYTYFEILNFLAESKITRSDLIIALGGGVVGDITGFAAATYLRGISYIQIPTSLLAMVDSSVGGKTAIDLPSGKNLVGSFKQPDFVLCDVNVLSSLPHPLFIDGCAEVIKYGMLYDAELINYLQKAGPDFDCETVITKCVSYKAAVIQADEFDTGERQKLNFGHTIGHGIETKSNFTISHGQAVAAGMAIITKAAYANGMCSSETLSTLLTTLQLFSLPTDTNNTASALFRCALSDKKRSGGSVNLIIPRKIGSCDIVPTPISKLESFIEDGLL